MWTVDGDPISIYCALNELEESHFVVNRIKIWYEKGNFLRITPFSVVETLNHVCCKRRCGRAIMLYRIYGCVRFFERQKIKNVLAYLPYDSQS
ncbi:DNA helicase II [Pantoea sp. Nvir]|nr:DNA helicase II [Pantoea sp. Nvir]